MPFSVTWHTLLDELDDLPEGATFVTPLSQASFRVSDVQEHRIVIEFHDSGGSRPLQREQFETLYQRIEDAMNGFELDRLPPDAEPYATMLSVHPRFEVNDDKGTITKTDAPTSTELVDVDTETDDPDREEPDIPVYADVLLLIDALERTDPTALSDMDTPDLVNIYTLLSDVQRNANALRQDVSDVLLDRLHHDRPVAGQYGSVQRTTRRNRSLKDEDEVIATLDEAGIEPERVMGVDQDKVDDALAVTELSESDVYDINEREYVRKAEVNEDIKETRLQGLKDRLAASESADAEELQQEIEELEQRIDELTSFESGQAFHTPSSGES